MNPEAHTTDDQQKINAIIEMLIAMETATTTTEE